MNKNLVSLFCLTLIASTIPSCRNCKKENPAKQEDIETMIELDTLIEDTEKTDTKVSKF